jgi:tripartite-type tricarboxylate transporter receptor subunit TctC
MKLPRRRQFLHLAACAAALPAVSCFAWAQAYPTRPVRIVVGFAPGGAFEIVARLIGQWLSERLGQPFVIENRPGGGSNIATLLMVSSANAINTTLYDKLNFNFIRDIAPVAGVLRGPYVLVVNPSVPTKSVPEFIAYAKANPGKINMASSGNGTAPRRGARACRSARRAGAGHARQHRLDRIREDRQTSCPGGDNRDALGGAARPPNRRRVRAGL